MHRPHEGDGEIRPFPGHLRQIALRFVHAAQLSKGRNENRVARPLEARLRQRPERKTHRRLVLPDQIFCFGHAREIRAHVRILRAEPDGGFQMRESLARPS